MNESITLRPRFGQILTLLVAVIVLVALVTFPIVGDYAGLLRFGGSLLLLAYLAWLLFWSPSVTIDDAGVVIRNLLRSHRVTWPSIQRIDTKFALTLFTTGGKFSAWAAPAPSRASASRGHKADLQGLPQSTFGPGGSIRPGDLPSSESGQAGMIVRMRYEALREAGFLDSKLVEGTGVQSTWLWTNVAILVALGVATALGALL